MTKKLRLEAALAAADETRALVIASGALAQVGQVFLEQFPGHDAMVVADVHTFERAGYAVHDVLQTAGIGCLDPFVYDDPGLYAEYRRVEQLEQNLRQHNAIAIAVGSGTINDLAKLASHLAGRQYMCVPTAASVDGYTAFGASITHNGAKQTFDCPAPRAVVADIEIIRRAPPELTASGYGDLSAKIPAGADWILADALGVEPIDPTAWDVVQGGIQDALADPAGARAGKASAILPLVEGLMLSGFAMQRTKSSRPASGAEHQFSHLWDMEHHTYNGEVPRHGFKVGIGTVAITRLYEYLLAQPLDRLDITQCIAQWPTAEEAEARARKLFASTDIADVAAKETLAKYISAAELQKQLERLQDTWPRLKKRLSAQLLPHDELQQRLARVGAPATPEEIGISQERLRGSFLRAQHIRRRFTVLDLATRTRQLTSALNALYS